MPYVSVPEPRIPIVAEADVVVAGGGSAGLSAAVSAARNGASVILVERHAYIGGLATGGMIILLLTMDDGNGRPLVGGVCQELSDRMTSRGDAYHPPAIHWNDANPALVEEYRRWGLVWGSGPHRVRYSVAFQPSAFVLVADELLRESGVRVLYQSWVCEPVLAGSRIDALVVQNKAGRGAIRSKVFVDATGDGDVFAAGGEEWESERVHPWLWFTMNGVRDVDAALASGKGLFFRTTNAGQVLVPWGGEARAPAKIDATNPDEVSAALVECREMVRDEAARLKANVPGFEDAHVTVVADQLGITESRRLLGEYVMGRDDLDRAFDDTIARTGHWTKYDCSYSIPYRSLLPKKIDNLLVAGRCISVDHRVHHATKEIPPCMATGQAAGAAAAMLARSGSVARELDVQALRQLLREQDAIVD